VAFDPAVLAAEHLENQILVRFTPGADPGAVLSASQTDTTLGDRLLPDLYIVQLGAGTSVAAALSALSTSTFVVYAEPDYIYHAALMPNDPLFQNGSLWGMHNTGQNGGKVDADIDAPEAWDVATGAPGVVVGVIDTGIKWDHPDLAQNIWVNPNEIAGNGIDDDNNGYIDDINGWDFVNNDNNPMDDNGHGTHCAGTIGAVGDNGIGVAGVVWAVKMMGLKFLNAAGSGSGSNAIKAINYANQNGAKITSNSWGGGGFSQAVYDTIKAGRDNNDAIFVAAAGNNGSNNDASPFYPATYNLDNIVSVAATDRNDLLAGFSNYGATTVDLAAPGVAITSTWNNGGYNTISGTSMATPHVAGAVAMIRGALPGDNYLAVIQRLLGNVDVLPNLAGKVATSGRLRLEGLIQPPPPPPPPPPPGPGDIGDLVWRDYNLNGRQDASEPGVAGITVHLYDSTGLEVGSTTTDNFGNYAFQSVAAGTYRLKFDPPIGITFSPMDQGDDLGDSDVDPVTRMTGPIVVSGAVDNTVDAGLIPSTGPLPIWTIRGPGGLGGAGGGTSLSADPSGSGSSSSGRGPTVLAPTGGGQGSVGNGNRSLAQTFGQITGSSAQESTTDILFGNLGGLDITTRL
jgi:subtilisin family serine protease